MRIGFIILFSLTIVLTLYSCANNNDVDCSNALPGPDWFELGFFNAQGQPLIGSVYPQYEFRVFNASSEIFISPVPFGDPTRLQIRFPDFETNNEYFIELTAIDTDTLRFVYSVAQGPCFLNYNLQQVIFNNQIVEVQNSNRVDLVK